MSQAEELLDSLDETIPTHQHDVIDSNSYFVIDPITRAVENTSKSKNLLMQYDHASERYTFELPRYVEGHDMSLCTAVKVHYNNIESGTLIENADVNDLDDLHVDPTDANKVICSWLIKRQATQLVGSLNFLVQYLCATSDGTITYEWHSDIYKNIEIREGRNNGPAAVSDYTDILEQWRAKLFGVEDSITASILALLEDFSADVLKKDNTEEYTPTENYHPSTKKYVDDNISKLSEEMEELTKELENGTGGSSTGTGWNTTQINLLENIGQYLLFSDAKTGQLLFDSLITSLRNSASGGGESEEPENPDATLTSISATYTGGEVTAGTALSALTGITVIATYSDGSTVKVSGYALSGTIADGENTITVTYEGLTTTFTVTGVAESEGGGDTPTTYTITNSLTNVSTSNTAASVEAGTSYTATLTGNDGYNIDDTSVIITMGGVDVTSSVYVDGVITIAEVTGNIIIAASGVSSTLYVLAEPTTFDGASCIDTGAKLGTEEMFNSDWSIVVDITVTENVKTTVFHTGFGSRGSEHVYCSSNNNYSRWGIYFAKNNNSLGSWTNSCVIENKRFIVNHIAGSDDVNVSYLNESNELNTETVKRLSNYGFEGNFHDVSVILGGAYAYNDNVNVPSASFKGTVNDFKIYQRLMSEAEIAEYMGV